MSSDKNINRLINILILTAVSILVFRIQNINIWFDEGYQIYISKLPLMDLLHETLSDDTHPPGFYLITKIGQVSSM